VKQILSSRQPRDSLQRLSSADAAAVRSHMPSIRPLGACWLLSTSCGGWPRCSRAQHSARQSAFFRSSASTLYLPAPNVVSSSSPPATPALRAMLSMRKRVWRDASPLLSGLRVAQLIRNDIPKQHGQRKAWLAWHDRTKVGEEVRADV